MSQSQLTHHWTTYREKEAKIVEVTCIVTSAHHPDAVGDQLPPKLTRKPRYLAFLLQDEIARLRFHRVRRFQNVNDWWNFS